MSEQLENIRETGKVKSPPAVNWDVYPTSTGDNNYHSDDNKRLLKVSGLPWPLWPVNPHSLGVETHPRADHATLNRNDPEALPPPLVPPLTWITRGNLSDTTVVPRPPAGWEQGYRSDITYVFTHYDATTHTSTDVMYEHIANVGWEAVLTPDNVPLHASHWWHGEHTHDTWTRYDPFTSTMETVTMERGNGGIWQVATEIGPRGESIPLRESARYRPGINDQNRPNWLLTEGLTDYTQIPNFPERANPNLIYRLSYLQPHTNTVWHATYRSDEQGHLHLARDINGGYDVRSVNMPITPNEPIWNVYSTEDPPRLLEQRVMGRDSETGRWRTEHQGIDVDGTFLYFNPNPPPEFHYDEH